MVLLFAFLAFVIPAVLWHRGEKNKAAIAKFLKKRGYSEKNSDGERRWKKARQHGAIAYVVVGLLLLRFFLGIRMLGEDILILSIFWISISRVVYVAVVAWSFKLQESIGLNSGTDDELAVNTKTLEERDNRWKREPVPLVPGDEHGSAEIKWAEENGMADPDALRLGKGGSK